MKEELSRQIKLSSCRDDSVLNYSNITKSCSQTNMQSELPTFSRCAHLKHGPTGLYVEMLVSSFKGIRTCSALKIVS
jgi:hypothetical protein